MDDVASDAFREQVQLTRHQLHELRNRVTTVKGIAQLLERQVRRDDWERDKITERIVRLQDEIARLEELID